MKKIPYGISDYNQLITEDYYYVDKTMYLEKMENTKKILTFLRPRRFGKTLFTSMMYYYYDINSKDKFDTLFKDTYIEKNPTKNKNNYYVLKLDFSGMSGDEEELNKQFKEKVIISIKEFITKYNFNFVINEENSINIIMLEFLSEFKKLELKNKMYIIIDEYDNFTNSILESDTSKFKNFLGNDGYLKAFYAVIKEYTGLGVVDRVFITGVCSITLDSMTSGFNISTNITNDIRFNSMLGFTYDEVKEMLMEVPKDKQEEMFNLLKDNYDGYLFNDESKDRMFNSTLVLRFISYYYETGNYPKELVDSNITPNYKQIGNIVKLQNNNYYTEIIDTILKEKEIISELKENFSLDLPLNRNDIISLLYYFGYLTIDRGDIYSNALVFSIPNNIINIVYNDYLLSLLEISIDNNEISELTKEMAETGKIDKVTNYVTEILKLSDNRIFMNFDEKYIQSIYFTVLCKNKMFNVYNEYACSNGYIDLMLVKKHELCNYNIMIELKYIKQKDYNKGLLKRKLEEGRNQLISYSQDERITKDTKKYLVIFVGNKVKVLEEI